MRYRRYQTFIYYRLCVCTIVKCFPHEFFYLFASSLDNSFKKFVILWHITVYIRGRCSISRLCRNLWRIYVSWQHRKFSSRNPVYISCVWLRFIHKKVSGKHWMHKKILWRICDCHSKSVAYGDTHKTTVYKHSLRQSEGNIWKTTRRCHSYIIFAIRNSFHCLFSGISVCPYRSNKTVNNNIIFCKAKLICPLKNRMNNLFLFINILWKPCFWKRK